MRMKDLLKYRTAWMGFAILLVVLFHLEIYPSSKMIHYAKTLCYGGTDIFFFASGIGCYMSLAKDSDAFRFMKRRFLRIIPTYWCFLPFFFAFEFLRGDSISLRAMLGNLLNVQQFTGLGDSCTWYVPWLVVFYLLAPYLKGMADRLRSLKGHLFAVAVLIAFSVPFWKTDAHLIALTRLPIFYIGMVFAKECAHDRALTRRDFFTATLGIFAGIAMILLAERYCKLIMWSHGLYWYPLILATPGVCIAISCIVRRLETVKPARWIVSTLNRMGALSFEIFLVHVLVLTIAECIIARIRMNIPADLFRIAALACIYPLSAALRRLTTAAVSLFRRAAQKAA